MPLVIRCPENKIFVVPNNPAFAARIILTHDGHEYGIVNEGSVWVLVRTISPTNKTKLPFLNIKSNARIKEVAEMEIYIRLLEEPNLSKIRCSITYVESYDINAKLKDI